VVALVPAWGAPGEKFPVLVALHGRGEALKRPEDGAMGWARDYELTRAIARLSAPPLTDADFEGFSDRARMAAHNDALRGRPFGGVIVLCPYLPDLDLVGSHAIRAYGRFVVTTLLPHARRETPAMETARATGIDGVSLGGAVALRAGMTYADGFGAVGSLQPAVHEEQTQDLVALARSARTRNPSLALRLLTSDQDYFKPAVHKVSSAWKSAGISHEIVEVPGPHDYPFNRGPGALEMLLWHDRVLRT
jgi:predicted esterase